MKVKNKILSLLLVFAMVASLLPMSVLATEEVTPEFPSITEGVTDSTEEVPQTSTENAPGETLDAELMATDKYVIDMGAQTVNADGTVSFPNLTITGGQGTITAGYFNVDISGAGASITAPTLGTGFTALSNGILFDGEQYNVDTATHKTVNIADSTSAAVQALLRQYKFIIGSSKTAEVKMYLGCGMKQEDGASAVWAIDGKFYRYMAYEVPYAQNRSAQAAFTRAWQRGGRLAEPKTRVTFDKLAATFGEFSRYGKEYNGRKFLSFIGVISTNSTVNYADGSVSIVNGGGTATWKYASDGTSAAAIAGNGVTTDATITMHCSLTPPYGAVPSPVTTDHGTAVGGFYDAGIIVEYNTMAAAMAAGNGKTIIPADGEATATVTIRSDLYVAGAKGDGFDAGNDTTGDGSSTKPYATIAKAYSNIPAAGTGKITVLNDLALAKQVELTENKTVTIKGADGAAKPRITSTSDENSFFITDGTYVFQDLIIDGTNTTATSKFAIYTRAKANATVHVTLASGFEITKIATVKGAVYSGNGTPGLSNTVVIKDGAKIHGNNPKGISLITSTLGGVVLMEGGEISNNVGSAAIVQCTVAKNAPNGKQAQFKMTGGKIQNNTVDPTSCAVSANISGYDPGDTVDMTTIQFGGTAYVYNNKDTNGLPRNIKVQNDIGTNVHVSLVSALAAGAKLGVSLTAMPSATTKQVAVAAGFGGYTATAADANYFSSDIDTDAGISFAAGKVVLDYDKRTAVIPGLNDEGNATVVVDPATKGIEYAVKDGNGNIIITGVTVTGADKLYPDSGWYEGGDTKMTFTVPTGFVAPLQVVSKVRGADPATATDFGNPLRYLYVAGAAGDGFDAGSDTTGNGTRAKPYATFSRAVGQLIPGQAGVIILLSNVTHAGRYETNQAGYVATITSDMSMDEAPFTVAHKSVAAKSALWQLPGEAPGIKPDDLTFTNIIMDGTEHPEGVFGEFFIGKGSTLTLGAGAVLQNFTPRAINIRDGGTVVMLPGSTIKDCVAGINKDHEGYDSADNTGAAICLCPGGTLDLRGGTITGNTATEGAAGVFGEAGSTLKISGNPTISGNSANKVAANLYLNAGQTITLTGPITSEPGTIGVYVKNMPTAGNPVVIAKGDGTYTPMVSDISAFFSDKNTEAGVAYDEANKTIVLSYEARTTIIPGVAPDGEGMLTIDPKAGTDYSILAGDPKAPVKDVTITDKNGKVITPTPIDDKGWITFPATDGPFTVKPVPTGESISIVTNPHPAVPSTAPDPTTLNPTAVVTIPTTGGNLTGRTNPTSIVVKPSNPNLTYIVTDPDGKVVITKPGTGGELVLAPLDPNKDYVVTTMPTPKLPADPQVPVAPEQIVPGSKPYSPGVKVTTPATTLKPISPNAIKREETTPVGNHKIVISPAETDQEYAVIDPETGNVIGEWKPGTSGTVTFEPLIPGKEYQVVTRNPATEDPKKGPSLPLPGITVPGCVTVDPDKVTPAVTPDGKSNLTLPAPTDPDTKYAIVDPDTGKVVAPIGEDKDGWQTGDLTEDLVFAPVEHGKNYVVVTQPKEAGDTDETVDGGNEPGTPYPATFDPKNPVGPTIKVPTVTEDQLTGILVPGDLTADPVIPETATITIKPTDEDLIYAVVDPATNAVVGTWKPGTGFGGAAVVFPGLEPGKNYKVVTMPVPGTDDPAPPTTVLPDTGTLITTPTATTDDVIDLTTIDRSRLESSDEDAGEDSITIPNPGPNVEVAVIDPATGKVVSPAGEWQPGTAGGGNLVFKPLDPEKEYEIVVRLATPKDSIRVPQTPGIPVKKVGIMEVTGIVKDSEGNPVPNATVKVAVALVEGGYRTITATTDAEGKYVLKGEGIQLPGDYAIYVDSDKGIALEEVTLIKAQPQALTDITAQKNDRPDGNTNITGGAVSAFGEPKPGQTITVVDKNTGLQNEIDSPTGLLTTTDGGGYVLENLPDGTYIIQTAGTNPATAGMTEVVVKGGTVTPNVAGGYKSTNITATHGYFVKGEIKGLDAGETATVTVTVPVFAADGTTIIGAKNVTATATGTKGLYQLPGVPSGAYTVSVTTSAGKIGTQKITVGTANLTQDITVALPADPAKPGVITGVAVDKDGAPIVGGTVTIYNDKGEKIEITPALTTGTGGGYAVTGLPDGNYYVSVDEDGKNGLTGPIKVTGTKTEGKTTVTTGDTSKLLEGTVLLEDDTAPAVGATVVVKDADGNVIATTKTNANGQYFVGSVPAGATVSVLTADKTEEVTFAVSTTTANDAYQGDAITGKVADTKLVIVGPHGTIQDVASPAAPGKAEVIVTQPDPANPETPLGKTGEFDIVDGKLTVKSTTPDGTYTVTVKKDGMDVKKDITVSGGKITSGTPFIITTANITGTVKYEVGTVPNVGGITILGFSSAVNSNTGKYELKGVPDGSYEATLIVVSDADMLTKTVTLTVRNGQGTFSAPETGISVGTSQTDLIIHPSTAELVDAIEAITAAKDAVNAAKEDPSKGIEAITRVLEALDDIAELATEDRKQLDPNAIKELSDALESLLTDLTVETAVTGVVNTSTVKTALDLQKNLLVTDEELLAAITVGTEVDITLTLNAKEVTSDPTPSVQKDMNKVQALATAKGAEQVAYYDVTVEKTTVIREADVAISTTTTTVDELAAALQLTLPIPTELRGYQYYGVVSVHQNGTAQRLPVTATSSTVTFYSANYSTFAILASNEPIFEDDAAATRDPSSGGGGGGGTPAPGVTVPKHPGGTITLNPTNPGKGEDFIITVKPDAGYILDELTVTTPNGDKLTVTPMGDGKYKVTMPDPAVRLTVNATFKKLTGDPNANGVADWLNVVDHMAYLQGRDGGVFAPDAKMTRAEVAQMFYNLLKNKDTDLASKASFDDVPADAWYKTAVNTLANIGIVKGVGDEGFAPDRTITRAEFVVMAARFAAQATGGDTYADVPTTHWAHKEIVTATAYGWIAGYGDGTFGPTENITRSAAVKTVNAMLARIADKAAVDAAEALVIFPDVAKDHWAFYEVAEATNAHTYTAKDGVETWTTK